MEELQSEAFVLGARPFGESDAVVRVLTPEYGKIAGFLHGGQSAGKSGLCAPGTPVWVEWSARTADQLGKIRIEPSGGLAPAIWDRPWRLNALQAACAMLDRAVPEREAHPALYAATLAWLDLLGSAEAETDWAQGFVHWELGVQRALGFGLHLESCTLTGRRDGLSHVSPRTGRAVCGDAPEAAPYRDKLVELPPFLIKKKRADWDEILIGLRLSLYFWAHWVLADDRQGVPEPRLALQNKIARAQETESV